MREKVKSLKVGKKKKSLHVKVRDKKQKFGDKKSELWVEGPNHQIKSQILRERVEIVIEKVKILS